MDNSDSIFKLQVMTLLDSTSYGLLYAFISPYLITLGGDQVTIGIFTVTTLIFQLMSKHIVRDMINVQGQKAALYTIFNIAAVCHSLLFLTSSTCFTIMARCLFASTNQSANLIKSCLIKKVPPERKDYHMTVHEIMNSSGFIIGPIVTGALFDTSFPLCCFIASVLAIINIWILATLQNIDYDSSESEHSEVPAVRRCRLSVQRRIEELKNCNFNDNWDVLTVKYLFSASVIIFSTKYSPVLKYNYVSNHTEIGWVTSYMTMLIYLSIYLSSCLTDRLEELPPRVLLHGMFIVLFISLILTLYAPVLAIYCLMCFPVTLSRIIIMDTWANFVSERQTPNLDRAGDSVNILAGLTIPLIFGPIANAIGHHSVIIFSVIPIFLVICVLNYAAVTKVKRE